jgi:hypothetical protein
MCHIQGSQGQILAVAFWLKSLNLSKVCFLRLEAESGVEIAMASNAMYLPEGMFDGWRGAGGL